MSCAAPHRYELHGQVGVAELVVVFDPAGGEDHAVGQLLGDEDACAATPTRGEDVNVDVGAHAGGPVIRRNGSERPSQLSAAARTIA